MMSEVWQNRSQINKILVVLPGGYDVTLLNSL